MSIDRSRHPFPPQVQALIQKGVRIPAPFSIEMDESVNIDHISGNDVVIHAGCRISGADTLIMDGVKLGAEGPVTLTDCQIGPDVELKGGAFTRAVFLRKSSMGSGAHVRGGTILEEGASAAHTVGLKQTILFPFVTLGSLINFCDCLMTGGRSRKDHSEVGSSFIHFNYTPHQDKVTPSMMGDVPQGVMLNKHPIFLGGQGGLIGPCRLAFGTVTAAGTIYAKDGENEDRLLSGSSRKGGSMPYASGCYLSIQRIVMNNVIYIANLMALYHWYRHIRIQFISGTMDEMLHQGLMLRIGEAIHERFKQMDGLRGNMPKSISMCRDQSAESTRILQKQHFYDHWPETETCIRSQQDALGDPLLLDTFADDVRRAIDQHGNDYLDVIQGLPKDQKETGVAWLQGIVSQVMDMASHLKLKPVVCHG